VTTPPLDAPALAWREEARARLAATRFDVLVIGGGITGAGVARDAALRGLSVALVERDDFASGTSSRSSRLVHGGVRYLEHGYFHLVFEASRERRILLRTAPHLVRPLPFTWPLYRGARLPLWKVNAGLWVYDLLASFGNVGRHRLLSRAGVLASEPDLAALDLIGGARYWDAATDDAGLTLATVLDARSAGAVVLNHAVAAALTMDGSTVTGATVTDRLAGGSIAVRAQIVVNATGPWTDVIRRQEDPAAPPALLGTKGVHLAVRAERVGNRGAVTLLSPVDGRVMFVLPAGTQTIIGTTDTPTTEPPDEVRASRADVAYLLESVNRFFPGARLEPRDVLAAWAGIRPLIATKGSSLVANPAAASREHAITTGPRGVITITGGKLTTYRAIAEEVVDLVARRLGAGRRIGRCVTHWRFLPTPVRPPVFGLLHEPIIAGHHWTLGHAVHAVERELACTLADILIRRTKVAFAARDHGVGEARRVAAAVARHAGWSDDECGRQVERYRAEVSRIFAIDE
jgi:glycerol-3-phosphate dehydrogenase